MEKNAGAIGFRRAQMTDLERLLKISKVCFPGQLRWRGPKEHALKWWEHILHADYCEVWVCTVNGQVVGFMNLVRDIDRIYAERRAFSGGIGICLYYLIHYPMLTCRNGFRRVLNMIVPLFKISNDRMSGDITNNGGAIWIRPLAVECSMQGKGLGTNLIMMAIRRARELGYNKIRLGVERINSESIKLYQRLQFSCIGSTADNLLFERKTDGRETSEEGH